MLHDPLLPRLRGAGFEVLDLYDAYQLAMQERGWKTLKPWWISVEPLDGHPNRVAHEWLSEQFGAFVSEHPRARERLAAHD